MSLFGPQMTLLTGNYTSNSHQNAWQMLMAMFSAILGQLSVYLSLYELIIGEFYKAYAIEIQYNSLALDAVVTTLGVTLTLYDVYINWAVYHIYSLYDWYLVAELYLHLINGVLLVALLGLMVFIDRVSSGDLW